MRKIIIILCFIFNVCIVFGSEPGYSGIKWLKQSCNSSESMPCGGGDTGLNVWVENNDILFYISRSGTFDENNCLLKQGRVRIHISPNPFDKDFSQELKLQEGSIRIFSDKCDILIWVDVFKPVIHVSVKGDKPYDMDVYYENWRYRARPLSKAESQANSYKWIAPENLKTSPDSVYASGKSVIFFHKNPANTVFDFNVSLHGLNSVKPKMYNPIGNLISGGCLIGENLIYDHTEDGKYVDTDYRAWCFKSKKKEKKNSFVIALETKQTKDIDAWKSSLNKTVNSVDYNKDRKKTIQWWSRFWNRSYIYSDGRPEEIVRNYNLFRYMLACNAYGKYPTKFNGGLFTFDPRFVNKKFPFTPDFRLWGGGTFTAQNQRLVYWPMLKNGDFDMMKSQFDFYKNMLPNAELKCEFYWKHPGACFSEQIENYGLSNPAEYGSKRPVDFDKGVEYNAWLEYEWDTALEFVQMILERHIYNGDSIYEYIPLIKNTLAFFEEHYRYLAGRRGRKELDGKGHLIIYPGSGCETYKMAYNPSSTVAGLRKVLETYGEDSDMLNLIPPVPERIVEGKKMIAPAEAWERVNNVESPQLYPVFPWRLYGIGHKDIDVARNTYLYDTDVVKFKSSMGWKQNNIWAACLGFTKDAANLTWKKLKNGPFRFPAFWGPGFDWAPDHNQGGSAMIGLQEMLMQEAGDSIYIFPSWPSDWDVSFKLHASHNTIVEASLKDGKVTKIKVRPESRLNDIVILNDKIK